MDLKRWTRLGFLTALAGVLFLGGTVLSTEPVDAAGLGTQCPIRTCINTAGWSYAGGCTTLNGTIDGVCCDIYVYRIGRFSTTCRTNCIEV